MKLEELFNRLIEKGWKPFGRETKHELSSGVVYDTIDFKGKGDIRVIDRRHHHIRELVSKESGLWQFACENKLIEMKYSDWAKNPCIVGEYPTLDCDIHYGWDDYHHWLMESALCNEDSLEKFLLDNIKI